MTDEQVLLFSYPSHSRQLPESLMKDFLDKIIACSKRHSSIIDIPVITVALEYVIKHQAYQEQHSGEPYYHHPIQVALIAAKLSCKTEIIAASLLHDIVEDTDITINQIVFLFGTRIAALVNTLTKLDDIGTKKIKISEEHALQKLHQSEGMDAWYIKYSCSLADRLYKMQTLHRIKSREQEKRIALNTLHNFIPLTRLARVTEQELYTLTSKILEEI